MICRQCNNNVPNGSEYCPFCGNIVETIQTNRISDIEKGYTYLELKEWKKAKETFNLAVLNNDNKARAYIGRLLAKLKLSDSASLSSLNKKLTEFDDFKMAVKYADDNYKQQLKSYYLSVEEKIAKKRAKSKKRAIRFSISCVSLVIFLSLAYFVSGPILYKQGISLVNSKNYENAEYYFHITKNFKDSNKYYTYCKAQNLLAENDLESYNYFTECKDFLDSENILKTNEYFILVNKLQGEWYYPGQTEEEKEEELKEIRNSGDYYEVDGSFYDKSFYASYEELILAIESKGKMIRGSVLFSSHKPEKIEIRGVDNLGIIENKGVGYKIYEDGTQIEFVDDTHFKWMGQVYRKIEK